MYQQHREQDEIKDEDIRRLRKRLMTNMTYADIGHQAVGPWGSHIVNLFVMITQTGFCIQYYIFVGNLTNEFYSALWYPVDDNNTNLTNSTNPLLTVVPAPIPLELFVFLPIVLYVPLTCFRTVRQMGIISIIANVSVFIGFCSVSVYILMGKSSVKSILSVYNCLICAWVLCLYF